MDLDFLTREPPPPPRYDETGHRTNLPENRARERLTEEKTQLIEDGIHTNPLFKPPPDYRPRIVKKTRKIYIPHKEYPHANFIGLLIGPRGMTLKQMEADSGAKIAIRGRGSSKDGKGRADGRPNPGDDDELHCLIQADTDEQVQKAAEMIEKLLVPIPESENEHKKAQLRKLAALNGTLRDDEELNCRYCGSMNHRSWNCPTLNQKPELSICALCNQKGHRAQDCPLRGDHGEKQLDKEYESFMKELKGGEQGAAFNPAAAMFPYAMPGAWPAFPAMAAPPWGWGTPALPAPAASTDIEVEDSSSSAVPDTKLGALGYDPGPD